MLAGPTSPVRTPEKTTQRSTPHPAAARATLELSSSPSGQAVLDRTGNPKAAQKLLGHASITTTADIYTDWDIEQLAETMRQVLGEGEK